MQQQNLHINSINIKDGILDNDFGGYGKHPSISFPLSWNKVEGAKSYALYMIDYDATHVVGFPFIHWLVANIKDNKLDYDATHLNKDIIQGQNSRTKATWINNQNKIISKSELLEHANYTGPTPPDKAHFYTVFIFALDKEKLDLNNGFFLEELLKEIKDHIISFDYINLEYKKI